MALVGYWKIWPVNLFQFKCMQRDTCRRLHSMQQWRRCSRTFYFSIVLQQFLPGPLFLGIFQLSLSKREGWGASSPWLYWHCSCTILRRTFTTRSFVCNFVLNFYNIECWKQWSSKYVCRIMNCKVTGHGGIPCESCNRCIGEVASPYYDHSVVRGAWTPPRTRDTRMYGLGTSSYNCVDKHFILRWEWVVEVCCWWWE